MKIGIFTDSHYSSAELTCGKRYNSKSLAKINEAYEHFVKENCELVICLGDIIDKEGDHTKEVKNLRQVAEAIKKYGIKTFVVMGNHDGFTFDRDEFYGILGENCRPQNIYGDVNLIFLDACYFKNGRHYMPGDGDWENTFLPKAESLEKVLSEAEGNTYIFMHQNIDPAIYENHRLSNDAQVRDIIHRSGKVKTVFQGHYHAGEESEYDGIKYITYPAMCENEKAYFTVELR